MKNLLSLFIFCIIYTTCFSSETAKAFTRKLKETPPEWMNRQIDDDLSIFYNQGIKLSQISEYYHRSPPDHYLVRFTIRNNQIFSECKTINSTGIDYRKRAYEDALRAMAQYVKLPDTVFIISMHDAYTLSKDIPVFSMCKREGDSGTILVPDFDALREKFQVLPSKDLTAYEPRWEGKKNQLIWRGSTAQGSLDGDQLMRPDNVHRFSRVILCELSQQYPELIDAKLTFFAQGGENIPYLQRFRTHTMSFAKLVRYKYHLFIDGNVSPFSASCWKFFINSLVLKTDSFWYQWYFKALKPNEHYVPVKKDLSDLLEKVEWARNNDSTASKIAVQCRDFALKNLTLSDSWLYIYHLLEKYSRLIDLDEELPIPKIDEATTY